MSTSSLTPSRALRRPRRIDLRAVFGIALMLVAIGGSMAFWTLTSDARSVLIATRDLPATAVLSASDVAIARVRVDDRMYQVAIPGGEMNNVVGKALSLPVQANEMLVHGHLAPRPPLNPDQRAFTIPVTPDTAAGGRLRSGDSVEIRLTVNKGKPDVRTTVLLPRVTVYDVGYESRVSALGADSAGAVSPGTIKWLTLAVTSDQADALAQARWSGELDVALRPQER